MSSANRPTTAGKVQLLSSTKSDRLRQLALYPIAPIEFNGEIDNEFTFESVMGDGHGDEQKARGKTESRGELLRADNMVNSRIFIKDEVNEQQTVKVQRIPSPENPSLFFEMMASYEVPNEASEQSYEELAETKEAKGFQKIQDNYKLTMELTKQMECANYLTNTNPYSAYPLQLNSPVSTATTQYQQLWTMHYLQQQQQLQFQLQQHYPQYAQFYQQQQQALLLQLHHLQQQQKLQQQLLLESTQRTENPTLSNIELFEKRQDMQKMGLLQNGGWAAEVETPPSREGSDSHLD